MSVFKLRKFIELYICQSVSCKLTTSAFFLCIITWFFFSYILFYMIDNYYLYILTYIVVLPNVVKNFKYTERRVYIGAS